QPGPAGGGRGRGNPGATDLPGQAQLRLSAGLPVRQAGTGGTVQRAAGAGLNEESRRVAGFIHTREQGQRRFLRSRSASLAAEVSGYLAITSWKAARALSTRPRRRSTSASL